MTLEYDNFLFIAIAFAFVILNGFFVVAEFSMVKLRYSRVEVLKKKKGLRGRILYKVHSSLDTYLSACQLGITLASLALGWIGEPAFSEILEPLLSSLGVESVKLTRLIAFAIGFLIISFLHIVIGELMPKSMAIRQTEKWSLVTCIPLYVFYWVMLPFIWVLNTTANGLLKLFRLDKRTDKDFEYTAEEIKLILKSSHLKKPLREEHRDILLRMVEFSKLQAVDAMQPVENMVSLGYDTDNNAKINIIKEHLFTRYPVYRGDPTNIVGIIHTKDILSKLNEDYHQDEVLRAVLKVSHHDQLIDVLRKFQQGKPHFALVYNSNDLVGFITLDNLLSILLGRMSDEFNLVKEPWIVLSKNKFLIKTNAPVYAIEKLADVDLSEYDADNILDLLPLLINEPLRTGAHYEHEKFSLTINKVKNKKVKDIVLYLKID
ncbi:HlyC/CorC family transporter [Francisella sp. Scap27]|uniref:hemolysin family protein n=1 Tax=Francisella sp. Scap27 TaxID=2589986 RepID=UPI0015C030FE|nr:hemolysin family protein [Francisella sp. Scap27]QLE78979.1 HlyC/CorC family transporter [Francisella sp. Scap27]